MKILIYFGPKYEINETNAFEILQTLEAFLKYHSHEIQPAHVETISLILDDIANLEKLQSPAVYPYFGLIDRLLDVPQHFLRNYSNQ